MGKEGKRVGCFVGIDVDEGVHDKERKCGLSKISTIQLDGRDNTYTREYKATEEGQCIGADNVKTCLCVPLPDGIKRLAQIRPFHHLCESSQHFDLPILQPES